MTVNAHPKRDAQRYGKAIRGMRGDGGSGAHLYHAGIAVACHSAAPPPVEEYDAWLAQQPAASLRRTPVTGLKLRRMVVMKRGGCTLAEIGEGVGGFSGKFIRDWLAKLPPELAA